MGIGETNVLIKITQNKGERLKTKERKGGSSKQINAVFRKENTPFKVIHQSGSKLGEEADERKVPDTK